uniref:transcription factor HHO5-like isoform X2 n=1 Tax=Erigeron canadensis TaxID=72917 RepID=UPI001CB8AB27|nr:transcription factor HHO5-like isoform X2 [Erigeron canadensis]
MGILNPAQELSLDFKPTFIPRSITDFLAEIAKIGNVNSKILKTEDFVSRLETEVIKIDAFKRELPLCMVLMNDAIDALKEEIMVFKKSKNEVVLEEFMPFKKTSDYGGDQKGVSDIGDKKNWLSSMQLWNTNDNDSKQNENEKVVHQKRNEEEHNVMIDDQFLTPFKSYSTFSVVGTRNEDKKGKPVSGLSLDTPGINNSIRGNVLDAKTDGSCNLVPYSIMDVQSKLQIAQAQAQAQVQVQPSQQQSSRKQRRCWSTELHRRFVNALHQLGGSKATPKQIRELMQVDGLTNDEVKSHLQKYRLHTKRHPSALTSGGSWTPPQDDQYVGKHLSSKSGSPDGPLPNCTTGGTSTTGGDSMDDEEDEKSENNCWKGHLNSSSKNYV